MLLISFFICSSLMALDPSWEEAAFYDNEPAAESSTSAFISYFSGEMREWTIAPDWTTNNNDTPYGVDTYDLVYFAGHGNVYLIAMNGDGAVDISTAGDNPQGGYGMDLEFLILQSCLSVPSLEDDPNAWGRLCGEPNGIFDGLHILMGFRTLTYLASYTPIAHYMASVLAAQSMRVIDAWWNAVDSQGDQSTGIDMLSMYSLWDGNDPNYCAQNDVYGQTYCYDRDSGALWNHWFSGDWE